MGRASRMVTHMKYTRFEKARIIGARALQISYGAPVLDKDLIPITVVRN